jgi:hypothetical protein
LAEESDYTNLSIVFIEIWSQQQSVRPVGAFNPINTTSDTYTTCPGIQISGFIQIHFFQFDSCKNQTDISFNIVKFLALRTWDAVCFL